MNELLAVLRKEWLCFVGGERCMLVVHGVIVVLWSLLFAASGVTASPKTMVLWLLPFSVIVVGNFSQTVFVAERVNGAIEILLTSGIGRCTLMLAKMLFVAGLGLAMGSICLFFGLLWVWMAGMDGHVVWPRGHDLALFTAAVMSNTGFSALFSVVLPNPRLTHFAVFFLMAAVLALYYPLAEVSTASGWLLTAGLALAAIVAAAGAVRAAGGERISRPVGL